MLAYPVIITIIQQTLTHKTSSNFLTILIPSQSPRGNTFCSSTHRLHTLTNSHLLCHLSPLTVPSPSVSIQHFFTQCPSTLQIRPDLVLPITLHLSFIVDDSHHLSSLFQFLQITKLTFINSPFLHYIYNIHIYNILREASSPSCNSNASNKPKKNNNVYFGS